MLEIINTEKAPKAIGPYSQAVVFGDLIFTSGQIALIPESGEIDGEEIEKQTIRVCENLKGVLSAAGSDMTKVIKTTCFLKNMDDFAQFNKVYSEYFISCPARSCVAVKTLPKNVLVEIEAVAVK